MAESADVPAAVRTLAAQVAAPSPMRRGSRSERYVKCSKPGCACAERPAARHGPYYSLTRTVGGRTQSRFVPAAQAARVRQQTRPGSSSGATSMPFLEACEQWADAHLDWERATTTRPKKGAPGGRHDGSRRGDHRARRLRRRRGVGLRGD